MTAVRSNSYQFSFQFTGGGAGAPTGADPNYGTDMVLAHTGGTNEITITFPATKKPLAMNACWAGAVGDDTTRVGFSYVASTGILTLFYFNAAGADLANPTTVTHVTFVATRSQQNK
jgi:hypothetical protein